MLESDLHKSLQALIIIYRNTYAHRRQMDDIFYTTNEVAQILRIKEGTVRKWVREEKIDAVKFGRVWRISEKALKIFVAGGRSSRQDIT